MSLLLKCIHCGAWIRDMSEAADHQDCKTTLESPPAVLPNMTELETLRARMKSLETCCAHWAGDWSQDKRLAWIYGIVCGWDDEALAELCKSFGWSGAVLDRLKTLMPIDRNS